MSIKPSSDQETLLMYNLGVIAGTALSAKEQGLYDQTREEWKVLIDQIEDRLVTMREALGKEGQGDT